MNTVPEVDLLLTRDWSTKSCGLYSSNSSPVMFDTVMIKQTNSIYQTNKYLYEENTVFIE